MSKTTTLLLVVTLFAAVAVHSVNSAVADSVTLTNSSFYKEKGYGKIASAGDASLADTVLGRRLIAGKNSKTNYYAYQTNTPTDSTSAATKEKGGSVTIVFKKVDVNKLALTDDAAVTVTGFKWAGVGTSFQAGASVKNNVTLVGSGSPNPNATLPLYHLYAYVIDLDKNQQTEILVASAIKTETDLTTYTSVSLVGVHTTGSLTVIIYTLESRTATTGKYTTQLVTLKDGKLGTPSTLREVTESATQTDEFQAWSATGENLILVYQSYAAATASIRTETVYPFTVTEKEVKAGTTAVINTNVADTNTYSFITALAHAEGRWVAVYGNRTGDASPYTFNRVAKASNDTTGFKVLASYTVPTGTSKEITFDTYLAGLVLWFEDGTTSDDGDTYTYSYQTVNGDLTTLGTKTAYLMTSGKYADGTSRVVSRLGDNKAYNLLVTQIKIDTTVDPTTTTREAVYFGQLFQKSFGATLQSVLAVCSLMLAALFIF